jgi:predicted protein tyrosine phosphatase
MLSAVNIPKEEAEAILLLPDDSALISIGEEHEKFWNLQVSGERVLRMVFSDVTTPTRKGDKYYSPMDDNQARKLVEFIKCHQDRKFIVNCRAGISRSSAVCLFIHQQYGHGLKPHFWNLSYPNPWVLQRLRVAQQALTNPEPS